MASFVAVLLVLALGHRWSVTASWSRIRSARAVACGWVLPLGVLLLSLALWFLG
jgi:hypothetical protein